MKQTTIAYTAGIIDGEGSILICKHKRSHKFKRPIVSVTNTDLNLIQFLKDNFGGTICNHKTYKPHHKKSWKWALQNNQALDFCKLIYPFLKSESKSKRANLLITEYKSVTPRNGKYSDEMVQSKFEFEQLFLSL